MATPLRPPDRRVVRTRQLLMQAFQSLAREQDFAAIRIQDITERANVNRGTFYAHFPDKYAMLEALIREELRRRLGSELPASEPLERAALQHLVIHVLEIVRNVHKQCRPPAAIEPLFEQAIHDELRHHVRTWIERRAGHRAGWGVPVELIAHLMSWAIFGGAVQWGREPTRPVEEVAQDIVRVVLDGVLQLAPNR